MLGQQGNQFLGVETSQNKLKRKTHLDEKKKLKAV
jgi:hypothetical protein